MSTMRSAQAVFVLGSVLGAMGLNAIESGAQSLQERVNALLQAPRAQSYRIYNVFGEKEIDLKVHAILNDKALIQNAWYKRGDKIGAFVVDSIGANRVVLVDRKSLRKELRLQKQLFGN